METEINQFAKFQFNIGYVNSFFCFYYSRLSLSRLGLSRITAYLEVKIWSLLEHGNLSPGNKILWMRGEIAPKEQFLPFPTIFSIHIFN